MSCKQLLRQARLDISILVAIIDGHLELSGYVLENEDAALFEQIKAAYVKST